MTHYAQNHYECISLYGFVVAPKVLNTTINSSSWATKIHKMSSGGQDTEQAVVAHSVQFYLQFNSNLANKDHTAHPLPDETVMKVTDFMQCIKDGSTVGDLRIEHPRGYILIIKYDLINLVAAGGNPILVYRQKPDESGNMPPVDQSV
jgi:hypothetical protein